MQRPTVLVVEDELGPRESLRQILQSRFDVFTCTSGSEALSILQNEAIDLITLDLKLPGTPGSQLMADFRRQSPQCEMLIISGSGTLDSAIEGMRHGVGDFITKPFGVIEVLAAADRAMRRLSEK